MSGNVVSLPENPMPPGGKVDWLGTADNARLRYGVWMPDRADFGAPRGTIVLVHGRTEFIEKYFETIGDLLARGFAVATFDWRGQGLSDRQTENRRKGHVRDFISFDRDLMAVMERVVAELPRPWIALGHSMGGNVLVRAAHDHADWFSGVVLSAPMVALKLGGRRQQLVLRMIALGGVSFGLAEWFVPGGNQAAADEVPFEANVLTRDRQRYEKLQALLRAEPRLGIGSVTMGWLHAAFRTIEKINGPGYLEAIETPVLIAAAQKDALVPPEALAEVASRLARGELVRLPDAQHEILIERDEIRQAFWRAFDRFTDTLSGTVSG